LVPDAGTFIRVEDHADKNRTVETESTVTTVKVGKQLNLILQNKYRVRSFEFAYIYDKATIFFGFGTKGTEKIYYFDDEDGGNCRNQLLVMVLPFKLQ
jgi:hypothetical protein